MITYFVYPVLPTDLLFLCLFITQLHCLFFQSCCLYTVQFLWVFSLSVPLQPVFWSSHHKWYWQTDFVMQNFIMSSFSFTIAGILIQKWKPQKWQFCHTFTLKTEVKYTRSLYLWVLVSVNKHFVKARIQNVRRPFIIHKYSWSVTLNAWVRANWIQRMISYHLW